jgi:hypothetical protein
MKGKNMSKKIENLTNEDVAQFDVYVNKWLDIGLSTAPADFESAKEAACRAYVVAGLKAPSKFYTAQSPIDAIKLISTLDKSKKPIDILSEMSLNHHDAGWFSFYNYFQEVKGLECVDKLQPLMDLSKHCGWVSFYDNCVVLQERPEIIKFDDQKRLHCEDGPSICYRDGYSVYSWHGVRIPSEWIEHKANLTPKIALSWENIEQRRCACEIIGWAKILRELNSKVIDTDDDPMIGSLLEVNIPDIGREKFLQVLCGTGRTFAIPVPPTCKTALEANAWTFGIEPEVLRDLEVRT